MELRADLFSRMLWGMANEKRKKVRQRDITGLKYFDRLGPLLERLHDDGVERDKAKNRQLHFDQYCMLVLLFMFNPVVSSLRAIQQASELKNVQKKLGCRSTYWKTPSSNLARRVKPTPGRIIPFG